jgi:acetyl-CoA carboxylase biotin carboxylase subunit
MGIDSALVYSPADADSLPVQMAREAYPLSSASYLDFGEIVFTAKRCGAHAIHPGYGFLSERSDFSNLCERAGLAFIGPPPRALEKICNKSTARSVVRGAGVPVIPGVDKPIPSLKDAEEIARVLGFPVLLKATLGGGGRGIRTIRTMKELRGSFALVASEAEKAFGRGGVYMEKMMVNPRHIEIQVLADRFGQGTCLGERECSIQRRHQKIMEEGPSPFLDDPLRESMGQAALKAASALGFKGAGTVEFLVDADRTFSFLEMNPRIQVEHPVTELITGVDLVEQQILIAAGEPLNFANLTVKPSGWAIQCRITCEDPCANLLPLPGMITALRFPMGPSVRVDTHLYEGYSVPPFYDSLLAKILVWGKDRDTARRRMLRALGETVVEGVPTPLSLFRYILRHPDYVKGDIDTSFLERIYDEFICAQLYARTERDDGHEYWGP